MRMHAHQFGRHDWETTLVMMTVMTAFTAIVIVAVVRSARRS